MNNLTKSFSLKDRHRGAETLHEFRCVQFQ